VASSERVGIQFVVDDRLRSFGRPADGAQDDKRFHFVTTSEFRLDRRDGRHLPGEAVAPDYGEVEDIGVGAGEF